MPTIRERVLQWVVTQADATVYDVRRARGRPVTRAKSPAVDIRMLAESAEQDAASQNGWAVVATVEIAVTAVVDSDADIDDAVRNVHRAVMADATCGGLATDFRYTGCTWSTTEGAEGLAITAAMTFEAEFQHVDDDMSAQ